MGPLTKLRDLGTWIDGDERTVAAQIVAASALQQDQEIHNTYGEYGNSELVYKYGFALRNNPFDSVLLDKTLITDATIAQLKIRAYKARASFLEEFRYAACFLNA